MEGGAAASCYCGPEWRSDGHDCLPPAVDALGAVWIGEAVQSLSLRMWQGRWCP